MNKDFYHWKKPQNAFDFPYYECWLWRFPIPYSNILVPVWWSIKKRNKLLYNLSSNYEKYNNIYSLEAWKKRICSKDNHIFILGYATTKNIE